MEQAKGVEIFCRTQSASRNVLVRFTLAAENSKNFAPPRPQQTSQVPCKQASKFDKSERSSTCSGSSPDANGNLTVAKSYAANMLSMEFRATERTIDDGLTGTLAPRDVVSKVSNIEVDGYCSCNDSIFSSSSKSFF